MSSITTVSSIIFIPLHLHAHIYTCYGYLNISILPLRYSIAYALKIRREYAHVSESDFCTGRANFLRKTVAAVQEGTSIYATDEMRGKLVA